MDQLMEFLATIGDIVWLVTRRELRRLRDSVFVGIAVAALFILPGAFLGWVSFDFKAIWIGIGMLAVAVTAISLAYYRTPTGLTLSAAIDRAITKKPGLVTTVSGGGGRYVRFVAGFLTSELGAGLIAFWLPGHQYVGMTLFLIPLTMVVITYVIWKGGGEWWPTLVWRLTIATLVIVVATIFFPRLSRLALSGAGRVEDRIICAFDDARPECPRRPASAGRVTVLARGVFHLEPEEGKSWGKWKVTGIGVGKGSVVCFNATEDFYVADGLREPHLLPKGNSCVDGNDPEGPLVLMASTVPSVVQIEKKRR